MDGLMADDILKEAQEAFELCAEHESDNRKDYEDDIRFALLEEQWPEKVRREREIDGRPCLTANLLAPMVRQVVNEARQNKPGITVHPADDKADAETAEILNGIIRNIEQSSNAEVAYDTALECAVAGGFGYFRINTAYTTDDTFDQDIVIERIANPLSVYGDCYSTAADSSDWNTAFVVDTITKAAFEKQYKGADAVNWSDDAWANVKSPWLDGDQVMIAEYWAREEIKRPILLLSDGAIVEAETYTAQEELYAALGVTVAGQREVRSHKVTQRVLSGAEELSKVEWAGKYIPIIPVYGSEVNLRGKRHFRSLIRSAKDSQRMRNYWRTTSTELVALQSKAPFVGRKGAFETDHAKWATANTSNHAYLEYDGPDPPQRQPFAGIPAGALQEALTASDDIKAIVGIYDSSLGARSNETSGKAIQARDAQADTGTFHFIDNLSRGMRHAGRVILDLIPHTHPVPRVVRIIGKDGKPRMAPVNQPVQVEQENPDTGQIEAIEKIYDLTVGKYDLVVKAGPSFASKRDEFVAMASELMRGNPLLQQVLTPMIVENFDIPDADEIVEKLKAMSGENPAMKQMEQEAMGAIQQLQAQLQQVSAELEAERADKTIEARKLEIEAFNAETKRLQAMKPTKAPEAKAA
jgi:hypothetical protein